VTDLVCAECGPTAPPDAALRRIARARPCGRSGADISIGYDHTDAQRVNLYLRESFSFRVVTPEAAVALGEAPAAR
jgi:hypothetical protein